MKRTAKRVFVAGLLVVVPLLMSGCIVWDDCWWCDQHRPPQPAGIRAYVYDYYTGAPIPWGAVEIYEEDWWDWDYVGTWGVGPYGYVVATVGYLTYDDFGGGERRDYRVEAYAEGYYSEWVDITLSYYDPYETIYFYLAPWYRDGNRAGEASRGEVTTGEPRGAEVSLPVPE